MEMSNFTVVRAVLRNNYRSRNLIGPYCFWVISPRNSTLFTRPFLTGRRARAGHETRNARSVAKCMYGSSENDKRLTIVTNEEVCSSMNFDLVAFFGHTDATETT